MKSFRNSILFRKSWIFIILAFSFLFLGFYRDQWQVVREKKFSLFEKDVEAYVIARMVLTRQSGLFSNGGLLGWGDVNPSDVNEDDYQHQYDTYLKDSSFQTYWAKESHPGFQGIFFSALDRISPLSPANNLRIFRMLAAGLFAFMMTGVLVWFFRELGWLPTLFVFASILSSQWMTLFGRNLFFVSGLFYFPLLLLLFRLQNEKTGDQLSQSNLFWIVFVSILIKCLFNGFDFILPTLGMTASPLVFYWVKDKWSVDKFIRRFLNVALASLAAILMSLVILSLQVTLASGSLWEGICSIVATFSRRTLGNDVNLLSAYEAERNASTWSILKIYLSESYFYNFQIPYFVIIILFAIVSLIQVVLSKTRLAASNNLRKGYALIAVTWFSILGPLSWYIIFKSVAYFHTHMNYLPWHMPFTLFGFGLCGFLIQSLFSSKIKTTNA